MIFNQMTASVSAMMNHIYDLPFNQELANGTLDHDTFIFYLIQDALYLADYSRALAITGARLSCNQQTQEFIQFALGAIKAERELHFKHIQQNAISLENIKPSPACFMYTNYMLRMASTAPVEEAVASLLPCFWVYREVGKQIARSSIHANNPYQDWIDLYSGEEFNISVELAIDITNALGNQASEITRKNMLLAFQRATQLEYLFWHSAYQREAWAVEA